MQRREIRDENVDGAARPLLFPRRTHNTRTRARTDTGRRCEVIISYRDEGRLTRREVQRSERRRDEKLEPDPGGLQHRGLGVFFVDVRVCFRAAAAGSAVWGPARARHARTHTQESWCGLALITGARDGEVDWRAMRAARLGTELAVWVCSRARRWGECFVTVARACVCER